MSVLSDLAADVADALFDATEGLGVSATYTPYGGSGAAVVVLVEYGGIMEDSQFGVAVATTASLIVLMSDVAAPSVYDTVTIAGVVWTVRDVVRGDGMTWELSATRDIRIKMGRP